MSTPILVKNETDKSYDEAGFLFAHSPILALARASNTHTKTHRRTSHHNYQLLTQF